MSYIQTFLFYLLVVLIVSVLTKLAYKQENRKDKLILLFVAIIIFSIVAGIRYEVGSDWLQWYMAPSPGYIESARGTKGGYELGYVLIAKIVQFLGLGGTAFLFTCAFITYFFLFKTIDKYSEHIDAATTVFMYGCLYYLVSFNITRQAISVSIAMYAISLLDVDHIKTGKILDVLIDTCKQNILFFVWGLVSVLFHKGSVICFFALPLCFVMKKKNTIRWSVLAILFFLVINYKLFVGLGMAIMGSPDFQWYFIAEFGETGSWFKYIFRYLPYFYVIWVSYDQVIKNTKILDIYNITLIGLIINSLSIITNTEIDRVSFPFLYFLMILVGFSIHRIPQYFNVLDLKSIKWINKINKIMPYIIYVFIIWTMWYIFFNNGSYGVIPYKTIFGL